jgi:hypothetical protein
MTTNVTHFMLDLGEVLVGRDRARLAHARARAMHTFESKNDYNTMYMFARKFGFAEKMFKNIKVENGDVSAEDILREINRGGWSTVYCGNPPSGSRLTCAISTSLISSLSVIGPADATSPRFLSRKGQETNRRHSTDWPHGNICHRPDVCRGGATASAGRVRAPLLSGSLGGYDGLALILLGIAIVVVAATRFVPRRVALVGGGRRSVHHLYSCFC